MREAHHVDEPYGMATVDNDGTEWTEVCGAVEGVGEEMTLQEIYEKYKHLDACLSDTAWCNAEGAAIYGIAGEMWRAIKREVEKK